MSTLDQQFEQILASVARLATTAKSLIEPLAGSLVELLAPPRCGICEREGALLCVECRQRWIPAGADQIRVAGADAAAAIGPYEGGLGEAIRTAKYGGVPSLAHELGTALAPSIRQVARGAPFSTTLVPIPTAAPRVHERGFDHALILASAAGAATNTPVVEMLVRTRSTEPLHGMSRVERAVELHCAMALAPAVLYDGAVLPAAVILIDDVQTSGATVREAARVLRAAGVSWIGAVSVAHERGTL